MNSRYVRSRNQAKVCLPAPVADHKTIGEVYGVTDGPMEDKAQMLVIYTVHGYLKSNLPTFGTYHSYEIPVHIQAVHGSQFAFWIRRDFHLHTT